MKRTILFLCILTCDSTLLYSQTIPAQFSDSLRVHAKHPFKWTAFIIPAVLISYGVNATKSRSLKGLNNEIRDGIYAEEPHPRFHLDNYLQFAPGAAVLALNGLRIKGRHNIIDQAGTLLLSKRPYC